MSIIEAASVKVSTMADGTLRLTCDIEPRHAQAAFALFGAPGVPLALAALKPTSSELQPEPAPDAKGGAAARWLGMRCNEAEFQRWLQDAFPAQWQAAAGATPREWAASTVRAVLSVESRAEIDNDKRKLARFDLVIRLPFAKHAEPT